MNANLLQPTQTSIKQWLELAATKLSEYGITSSRLDSELIISHELDKPRTFLHAHSDELLGGKTVISANKKLNLRMKRTPIAYILGKKEFYGREFAVSPATLIPRPESEEVIECLNKLFTTKQLDKTENLKLVDVGTGSGILGITAKLEFPTLDVTLADVSNDALEIAQKNAEKFSANVNIINSDLLKNYRSKPNIILANLPYVDHSWDRSKETDYEPALALFADDNGQEIIKKLLIEVSKKLTTQGFIILESDPCQHAPLIKFAERLAMTVTGESGYILVLQKN